VESPCEKDLSWREIGCFRYFLDLEDAMSGIAMEYKE
jgi:hypothetical protein